ncbi:MAG: D-glycerate dehydrogenase [Patescibacteria group bacterium]|nr:D-glycerate dehydrogenase [Patescibacteria group bacterium]
MEKNIYITRKIPDAGLKLLKEKGINFDMGLNTLPPTKKRLINILKKKQYDGVISFLTDSIDQEIFEACPSIKVVANFSVGYNNIDLEEIKKRGILVSNTPGTSGIAVAEHAVALMLALTTRLVEGDKFVRKGKFKGWDPELLIGTDIQGKTIGLIGVGDIGSKVAQILHRGFGSNIIYSDINENIALEQETNAQKMDMLEVLKNADIISLHVPLLPSTKHLINKESLAIMKKSAIIINTSRGPVIDEKALSYALKNGTIGGAGLDVFEFEPKITSGLIKLSNVVLTPHIASARENARNMMSVLAAKNIISAFETGKVINNIIK